MNVALLFLAQLDRPSPILPDSNVWGTLFMTVGLLLVPVVVAVVLLRYLITTRRAAEKAASEASALRQELRQSQG